MCCCNITIKKIPGRIIVIFIIRGRSHWQGGNCNVLEIPMPSEIVQPSDFYLIYVLFYGFILHLLCSWCLCVTAMSWALIWTINVSLNHPERDSFSELITRNFNKKHTCELGAWIRTMLIFIMSFECWTFSINVFVKVMVSFFLFWLAMVKIILSLVNTFKIEYMLLIEETIWRSFEKPFCRFDS